MLLMKKIKSFVFLNLLLFSFAIAKIDIETLDTFFPENEFLRGVSGYSSVIIPVPDRFKVKKATLHLELSKSKALVPERSSIAVFFNGKLIFQKRYNPKVDDISIDINIPVYLIEDYNKLEIRTSQHYCVNCCEYEGSPELWTKLYWDKSYIKLDIEEKEIKPNMLYLRDFVLDEKQYNPLHFAIITENKSDKMLTLATKVSGYIGRYIKYRKIYIDYMENLSESTDTFLIGTENFVKKFLGIDEKQKLPHIFLIPNPKNKSKAIIAITAGSINELEKVISTFISLNKETFMGESITIKNFKNINIEPYQSPNFLPVEENIHLSDIGYGDKTFSGFYPPPLDVYFEIPVDMFLNEKEKFIFHLFYNYGSGVREDSVINVFVNDKFLTQIKIEKDYGTIIEDKKLKIPVYMLKPGKNKISVQYSLMPRNQGFCVAPNVNALQGTVFAKKTYLNLPDLPHWIEMPYMEYFIMQAYPFSIYPDLRETQIFISNLDNRTISAMLTLAGYIGEKTGVSPYNVEVISSKEKINPNKNLILIGYLFDNEFFENTPINISSGQITLKYSIFSQIKDILKSKILGYEEKENLKALLSINNKLQKEVIFTMGQSPYKSDKTVFMILSKNPYQLLRGVQLLYNPRYSGNIKGDISVIDFEQLHVYNGSFADKYYVGHLPFLDYILFKIGYTSPFIMFGLVMVVIVLIVIVLKYLLDIREKRRLKGEI